MFLKTFSSNEDVLETLKNYKRFSVARINKHFSAAIVEY